MEFGTKNTSYIQVQEEEEAQTLLLPSSSSSSNSPNANHTQRRKYFDHGFTKWSMAILVLLVTVCITSIWNIALLMKSSAMFSAVMPTHSAIMTQNSIVAGLSKCNAIKSRAKAHLLHSQTSKQRTSNPRFHIQTKGRSPSPKPILIKGGTIWDGEGGVFINHDILLKEGLIAQMQQHIPESPEYDVYYAENKIVSPGIVDLHSHVGTEAWPLLDATTDENEETGPLYPNLKSLDSFNPKDEGIRLVLSGGVTTILALPGSANMMGGEAFAFKLREVASNRAEEMLINYGLPGIHDNYTAGVPPRWMKMACGENPKGKEGYPSSRLGIGGLFRSKIHSAMNLRLNQDEWCLEAEQAEMNGFKGSYPKLTSFYPETEELESLVSLLRGDVRLNIHCYMSYDIEMLLRLSDEYGFRIEAFHHALDTHEIPQLLAERGIGAAIFADHWGYKHEAFFGTPWGPKILLEKGVKVALKSDHPVVNSQYLSHEAGKATAYGVSPQDAFKMITSIPADLMGVGHRVGRLRQGMDADVVIWDREPLQLGARPTYVFVDGHLSFEHNSDVFKNKKHPKQTETISETISIKQNKNEVSLDMCMNKFSLFHESYVVKNIGKLFLGPGEIQKNSKIRVDNGIITCIGVDCKVKSGIAIDLKGGIIIPGGIAAGTPIGMIEIEQEKVTSDGKVSGSLSDINFAADGIVLGGKHMQAAFLGGVTTTVTPPNEGEGSLLGASVAVRTGGQNQFDGLIQEVVALHFKIGPTTLHKGTSQSTISGQIHSIRKALLENHRNDTIYGKAFRGEIPIIFEANDVDHISSIVRLTKQMNSLAIEEGNWGPKCVIMGGSEAHLIREELAEAKIGVILLPPRTSSKTWFGRRFAGPPDNAHAAQVLQEAGVKVGLGVEEYGYARNQRWEAGMAQQLSNGFYLDDSKVITDEEAIGLFTWNLADLFGLLKSPYSKSKKGDMAVHLQMSPGSWNTTIHSHICPGRIVQGAVADFVAFNGNPLQQNSIVTLIAQSGKVMCYPRQEGFELL